MLTRRIGAFGFLTALVAMSLGHSIASADIPGKHPAYIHARSDLRQAELLLHKPEESNVTQENKIAEQKVHNAIHEIDKAAILDRKDIDDHPTIDTSLTHLDKFRAIYKLLRRAESDISKEEDNSSASGWRSRAKNNIEQAKHYVELAASRDVVDDLRNDKY